MLKHSVGCILILAPLLTLAGALADEPPPPTSSPREGQIRVVASVFPLADVAATIGSQHVEVTTLLPPGQTPHGYEPHPRQAEAIAQADLLLVVGLGMDAWAQHSARASGNEELRILVMAEVEGIQAIQVETPAEPEAHHHHAEAGHHLGDPHLWLDPKLMGLFADALGATLSEMDPARAADYRRNAQAFLKELDELDREYRQVLANVKRKEFVSFHSAFTYLAARYGLKQVAVFEANVEEFGPRQLERVVQFIKQHKIKVVFAEPQFPPDKLRALAQQTGAVVRQLDPLGHPGIDQRDSYLAMMRYNLARLGEALSE